MPIAENEDVLTVMNEIGVTYAAFGFPDETAYYDFVVDKWNRVDRLIDHAIGTVSHDEVAFPEQYDGHVYWTVAEVIRRKRLQLLTAGDGGSGGFTIGRYSVDSNAPTSREHAAAYALYKALADDIFTVFGPFSGQIGGAIFVGGTEYTPWANRPDRPMSY